MSNFPSRGADEQAGPWRLRLYVAGMTPVAQQALVNLTAICEAHLGGRYVLEVTDLLDEPERAEDDQILAVPTLVRESPRPIRKIIGDLSNTARVLAGLDVCIAAE